MINKLEFSALMIYLFFILIIIYFLITIFENIKKSRGYKREITGEIIKDLGIGLLLGTAYRFNLTDISYYVVLIISFLFIFWGVRIRLESKYLEYKKTNISPIE
jgi:hypothetical protein